MSELLQLADRLRAALEAEDHAAAEALAARYRSTLEQSLAASPPHSAQWRTLLREGLHLMTWALGMATSARARYRRQYQSVAHAPEYRSNSAASPIRFRLEC
jgi:hypothetical protein